MSRYSDEELAKLASGLYPGVEIVDEDAVEDRFVSKVLFDSLVHYAGQNGEIDTRPKTNTITARLGDGDLIVVEDPWQLYGQGRLSLRYWPDELPDQYRFKAGELVGGTINDLTDGYRVLRVGEENGRPIVTACTSTGHKSAVAPGYFKKAPDLN